jgi:cyclophilin family peptidyl-prolyl cis-trans isomerase
MRPATAAVADSPKETLPMIDRIVSRSVAFALASVVMLAGAGMAHAQGGAAAPAKPAAGQPASSQPQQTPPAPKPAETSPPATTTPAPTPEKPVAETPKLVYVKLSTNKGDIFLELNNEKAPISTQNFLRYVDKKYYDGTIFHRVMKEFMIQGGAFLPDNLNAPKPGQEKPIKNEWQNGLKNERGTVAMARTNDPDSATSQFFINVVDNPFLDQPRGGPAAYAVFGRVVAGMEVVDVIRAVKTAARGQHGDVPVEPVIINSAVRVEEKDVPKK